MQTAGLAIVGLALLGVSVASLVALHLVKTGYLPIRDAVSYYARSKFGALYIVQAAASGLAAGCLFALLVGTPSTTRFFGLLALVLYALSRIAITIFPADLPGETATYQGRVHVYLAAIAFVGIAVAAGPLTAAQARDQGAVFGALLQIAGRLTEVSAVVLIAAIYVRPLKPALGLVERFLYLGALSWIGLSLAHFA